MSNIIDVQQFLVGKTFHIPPYQRDYAWTTSQVDDLLSDIQEALDTASCHYLGTVVLARNSGSSYEVVDGQQRLSTLSLVIQALLTALDPADPERIASEAILLRQGGSLKLHFGSNATFVDDLISGNSPVPRSLGQRKIQEAYGFARERAMALTDQGGTELVKQWLDTIKSLEIIQFIAIDTGRAIRMFQTVNDRGIPLTAMDKAKALLVYYSNRYLAGAMDNNISAAFGDCFSAFDSLRELVNTNGYRIANIARDTFTEDDILRYHYLSYSFPLAVNALDYDGTVRTVFEGFLKGTLRALSQHPDNLLSFIEDYITDLGAFAVAFKQLIADVKTDLRIYKLFVVLGLTARLYPLVVRLYQRGLLYDTVAGTAVDLLHCIEVCDVRVYKTRGTDPARDIGDLSHRSRTMSVQEIADRIRSFTLRFMPDGTFQTHLSQDMYHNGALSLFLLWHDEQVAGSAYQHSFVAQLVIEQITREHIIAQTPNWSVTSQGFVNEIDFDNCLHMFGNLTLLSRNENSRCQNQPTHTKMTDPNLYERSRYAQTKQLAHNYRLRPNPFTKTDMLNRTRVLTAAVMGNWSIW